MLRGTPEPMERMLLRLVTALSGDDLGAIESATADVQKMLTDTGQRTALAGDVARLQAVQSLLVAAQSVTWTRLLSLCAHGTQHHNALLRKAV